MIKVELKTKNKEKLSVGANTELFINGELAQGVKSFKYEVNASGVGIVTIEYYANVEIEANVEELSLKPFNTTENTFQEIGNYLSNSVSSGIEGE